SIMLSYPLQVGLPRSLRPHAGLAPPEDDGGSCLRCEIGLAQLLLDLLNSRLAHPLRPKEHANGGVAEAARIFLTDHERENVHLMRIEMHQKTELGMQVDNRSRQPRHRGEIAHRWKGHSRLAPRIGLRRPIAVWIDQAILPVHMRQGAARCPLYRGRSAKARGRTSTRMALFGSLRRLP